MSSDPKEFGHSDDEIGVRAAAEWLARTHHHDWGLLDEQGQADRVERTVQELRPMVEAFLHIRVEQRMEVMGMVERRASFGGQTFRRCWTEDYS